MIRGALAVLLLTVSVPAPGEVPQSGDHVDIGSHLNGDEADVEGWIRGHADRGNPGSRRSGARARVVRVYVPACPGNRPGVVGRQDPLCPGARQICAVTAAPDDLAYWIFTAPLPPGGGTPSPSAWTNTGQLCRGPTTLPTAPTPALTAADFRRLPLPGTGIHIEPATGHALINIPTNLYTRDQPVTLTTTILGTPIRVRATPTTYTWTYGDGTHTTTDQPGAPYPTLDTAHTYTHPGPVTITLTTTYTGEYALPNTPWQPIDGTATVTSTPATLTLHEAHNHLVDQPLTP